MNQDPDPLTDNHWCVCVSAGGNFSVLVVLTDNRNGGKMD